MTIFHIRNRQIGQEISVFSPGLEILIPPSHYTLDDYSTGPSYCAKPPQIYWIITLDHTKSIVSYDLDWILTFNRFILGG